MTGVVRRNKHIKRCMSLSLLNTFLRRGTSRAKPVLSIAALVLGYLVGILLVVLKLYEVRHGCLLSGVLVELRFERDRMHCCAILVSS